MNPGPKATAAAASHEADHARDTLHHPQAISAQHRLPFDAEGPLPQPFGRYTLRERLGRGGMGTVFLADDTVLEVPVALKVPHSRLLADSGVLPRFYGEARAAARFWHPGLCQVFDVN